VANHIEGPSFCGGSGGGMMTTTREQVVEMRRVDPKARQIDMAAEIGVSRERVRQILLDEGLRGAYPVPPSPKSYCDVCGVAFRNSKNVTCRPCRTARSYVTVPCGYCQKPVLRRAKALDRQKHGDSFCTGSHRTKYFVREGIVGWPSGGRRNQGECNAKCPHCGYEWHRKATASRAHCARCRKTFAIASGSVPK